jgi:hypothetical protein
MYTIEQIIGALHALNAMNTTAAYASKFANCGSAYASQTANSRSPFLTYFPAATALAGVVAFIVCYYRTSSEEQAKARKIFERKQTGFFRPKRSNTRTARSQTRKLSAAECLQIMEVLANATDEVSTLNEENGDQHSDEELPKDVAETVLKEHFGRGIDSSSNGSSSDLSVDSTEDVDEEDSDDESTPTNHSRDTTRSKEKKPDLHVNDETSVTSSVKQEPDQFDDEPQHHFNDGLDAEKENEGQFEQVAENEPEQLIEEAESQSEQELESIMSDDEGYARHLGRSGSPDSFATANIAYDAPRRSSWHGEGMIHFQSSGKGNLDPR